MEAVEQYVIYNDSKQRRNNNTVVKYTNNVRSARVAPDGLGPTATRGFSGGYTNIIQNSAFYEVKSGNSTLNLEYNDGQLHAMLEVLSRSPAAVFGNATLFIVCLEGVDISNDLIVQASLYKVNLVKITPSLISYENEEISFDREKLYTLNHMVGFLIFLKWKLNSQILTKLLN
jgi:hypothetical protein